MAAVASRYARALADAVTGGRIAAEAGAVEQQLHGFLGLMQESADLRNVLISPAVGTAKKKMLVEALGGTLGLTPVTRNFLYILLDHKRMALLQEILALFRAEMDERQGMVEAAVSSAAELSAADRASLETALARKTGKEIRAKYVVDPSLIGGAVTRVGSTVYDGSVREQLRLLRAKLSSQ